MVAINGNGLAKISKMSLKMIDHEMFAKLLSLCVPLIQLDLSKINLK